MDASFHHQHHYQIEWSETHRSPWVIWSETEKVKWCLMKMFQGFPLIIISNVKGMWLQMRESMHLRYRDKKQEQGNIMFAFRLNHYRSDARDMFLNLQTRDDTTNLTRVCFSLQVSVGSQCPRAQVQLFCLLADLFLPSLILSLPDKVQRQTDRKLHLKMPQWDQGSHFMVLTLESEII